MRRTYIVNSSPKVRPISKPGSLKMMTAVSAAIFYRVAKSEGFKPAV